MAAKKPTAKKRKLKHSTRPDLDALSAADIRFCQHYAEHGNATEAYKQAGYFNSGKPDYVVGKAAWVLVRKSKIREHIRELREQAADVAGITVGLVAQGFKRAGFADRTKVFDSKGHMLHPRLWPEELRAIIVGFEPVLPKSQHGQVTWKVKFESGTEAKKVLATWKGMIGNDKGERGEKAAGDRVVIENDGPTPDAPADVDVVDE